MKKLTLLATVLSILTLAGCQDGASESVCINQTASLIDGHLNVCDDNTWSENIDCTEEGKTICGDNFIVKCSNQKWEVTTQCASFQVCKTETTGAVCVDSSTCQNGSSACDGNTLKSCVNDTWTSTPCQSDEICQTTDSVASCVKVPAGCDTDETTCADNVLTYCEGNTWKTKTCEFGCADAKTCKDNDAPAGCDTDETTCTENVLTYCEGNTWKTKTCEFGCADAKTCKDNGSEPDPDTCDPQTYQPTCDTEGNLTSCTSDGKLLATPCSADETCKTTESGAECSPADPSDNDCDEEGQTVCDGNNLKSCEGGEWEVHACAEKCKEDEPGKAYCFTEGTDCTSGATQCEGTFKIITCVEGRWQEPTDCSYGKTCQDIDHVAQCSNTCKPGRGICNYETNTSFVCNADKQWELTSCEGKRCAISEKMSKCIVNEGEQCSLYKFKDESEEVEADKALCDFDHMFVCSEEKLVSKQPYCGTGDNNKTIKLCADDQPIYRPCYQYAWIDSACEIGNITQILTKQNLSTGESLPLEDKTNDATYIAAESAMVANSSCETAKCINKYYLINKDNCNDTKDKEKGCFAYKYDNGSITKTDTLISQTSDIKFVADMSKKYGSDGKEKADGEFVAAYYIENNNLIYTWFKANALTEHSCEHNAIMTE